MLKKIKPIHVILFLIAQGLFVYSLTEPPYTPTALSAGRDHHIFPRIIAHQAFVSSEFPGNSRPAINEALSSTIDGIEVDVRLSKDGRLFLYHGDTLDEYTNHHGIPEDYTWDFLSKVTYKNTHEKLVLLDDFLDLVGNQKAIFLDIKSDKKIDIKMARLLVDAITKRHLQDTVYIESFNPITLAAIRLYRRDIILMYDFTDNTTAIGKESQQQFDSIPWLLKQYWVQMQIRRIIRPDILGSRFNMAPSVLKKLIAKGYPLIVWTVDQPHIAQSLYDLGIKGLQSNCPKTIEHETKKTHKKILDAGESSAIVHQIVHVKNPKDIQDALRLAKQTGQSITIGGRRHSMGGQTLCDHSIFLDMLSFNHVTYHDHTKTVTAQAGATWKKIQEVLTRHQRSVKVMQSDNIFTVGGSIGVNVHGWQIDAPPIGSTLKKMTVMTADGVIHTVSPTMNPELFKAVIGGYGLFAIILEAELETMPNAIVQFHCHFAPVKNFDRLFKRFITNNPKAELAYARLSTDADHFLDEVGLFWFENQGSPSLKEEIEPENLIAVKRFIFRMSEYHDFGKKIRWKSEKAYTTMMDRRHMRISRNDAMNTDIHILWPLYGNNKDILQEYFIPKKRSTTLSSDSKNTVCTTRSIF